MANTIAAGAVIQRRYLQLYLVRLKRRFCLGVVRDVIGEIQAWVRAEQKRTKRPGGLGRK